MERRRFFLLRPTYIKALNILNKMPVHKEFVTEQEAPKFSQELAQEMAEYPAAIGRKMKSENTGRRFER